MLSPFYLIAILVSSIVTATIALSRKDYDEMLLMIGLGFVSGFALILTLL